MTGSQTILLVDDEAGVRLFLQEALEDLGYEVLIANDGQEGLTVLESDTAIDLLISDVMMPRMNGPTMVAAARFHRPVLPVVFITGYSADLLASKGVLGDRMSVLAKPFGMAELSERVQMALAA